MATTFKWQAPETYTTYMGASLNSLANLATAGGGPVIANETGLYQFITFELALAALSPSSGAYVDIWIQYALNGSNFADSAKALQTSGLLTMFQLDTTASSSQRVTTRGPIPILPFDFKLEVRNQSGVQLSGVGAPANTLSYRRYYDQGV